MADKKPSGFRFRLPWLIQPAIPDTREPPTQPPRTTTQTSVSSTPAQRPPFRPPGKAPAPPPAYVSPKSPVSKSTAKTTEPVAAQTAKETQSTTETSVFETPPQTPPSSPPPPPISRISSVPNSPTAKTLEPVAAQPAKETQTTNETIPTIETAGTATPPLKLPSPLVSPNSSAPNSPIARTTQPVAAQSPKETQTTIETIPTVVTAGQTRTPPRSPSQLASEPANKSSSPSSPPNKTTRVDHFALNEKPREITKSRGTQTKSMELKSQKPKSTATRVPLHREIKDDISKFIHNIATSSAKQSTDEKPANIITIAGDNTGASMRLGLDKIKRGYKLTTDTTAHDAADNGDSKASENKEPKAIVNSNIQGINNSLMFDSSVKERSPGVHLDLHFNQANMNDSIMNNTESIEMQKAEVNITPPQRLVYDPTMEASEFEFEEDDPQTSGRSYEIEVL